MPFEEEEDNEEDEEDYETTMEDIRFHMSRFEAENRRWDWDFTHLVLTALFFFVFGFVAGSMAQWLYPWIH